MSESSVRVIDSHTEGEPTRVVVSGGPELGHGTVAERLTVLRSQHDWLRTSTVCEPRGSDAVVGALLCEPSGRSADVGVIFYNNVGYLGMCGHGTMGLVRTLQHVGRLSPGTVRIETPVGIVSAELHKDGRVSVRNVPAYRHRAGIRVDVPEFGSVSGDVAYGGNWFFLAESPFPAMPVTSEYIEMLTAFSRIVRRKLEQADVRGADGAEVDHIEIFAPPRRRDADSKNFVLCPGLAYDRSPCGTGLSAKLACLAAEGKLEPGQPWRQESIIGTLFEGSYEWAEDGRVLPTITGSAFVTAEADLIIDPDDPLRHGIRL